MDFFFFKGCETQFPGAYATKISF